MTNLNLPRVTTQPYKFVKDGFVEIEKFCGHSHLLKGCEIITLNSSHLLSHVESQSNNDAFLTWDSQSLISWQIKKTKYQYLFPDKRHHILSIVYIYKFNIYVGSTMDSTFKLFNQKLEVIGDISHKEDIVVYSHYNQIKDEFYTCNRWGISVWKITKEGILLDESNFFIRKIDAIGGVDPSTSRFDFDQRTNRLFTVIKNCTTVRVFELDRFQVLAEIEGSHDSLVTQVCWHRSSGCYVTGSMRGMVLCWSSRMTERKPTSKPSQPPAAANDSTTAALSVLQSFQAHSRAVTGLCPHPSQPSQLLTASLDGSVKILDLESLQELLAVPTPSHHPVTLLRTLTSDFNGGAAVAAIALSDDRGMVRVWRIPSVLLPLAQLSQPVIALALCSVDAQATHGGAPSGDDPSATHTEHRFLTVTCEDSVLVYFTNGSLVSRVEPNAAAVAPVFTVLSTSQRLLLSALPSGSLAVFCTQSALARHLLTVPIAGLSAHNSPTCAVLVDGFPSGAAVPMEHKKGTRRRDLRGNTVTDSNFEEALVVGTSTGSVLWLDLLGDCHVVHAVKVQNGQITGLRFLTSNRVLIVFSASANAAVSQLRAFSLLQMELLYELLDLEDVSCFVASDSTPALALGTRYGFVRLFRSLDGRGLRERGEGGSEDPHSGAVLALSFSDSYNLLCSSSADLQVRIWDFNLKLVRVLQLNAPSPVVQFCVRHGANEDIFVAQESRIMVIPGRVWGEGYNPDPADDDWLEGVATDIPPSSGTAGGRGSEESESVVELVDSADSVPQRPTVLPSLMSERKATDEHVYGGVREADWLRPRVLDVRQPKSSPRHRGGRIAHCPPAKPLRLESDRRLASLSAGASLHFLPKRPSQPAPSGRIK